MTTVHTTMDTPLGELTLLAEDGALTAVYFPGHKRLPDPAHFGERQDPVAGSVFAEATRQLEEYFAGERTVFDLPLAPKGEAFQRRVWAQLRRIPYGETRTYGRLAAELGDRHLAQAVGYANGHNPISIVVPCHRVIGSDGSLVGYAGGLERKRFLLDLEEPPELKAGKLF